MKLLTLVLSLVAFAGIGYADVVEVRHYRTQEKVRYVERREVYIVERPVVRYVQPAPIYYVEPPRVKCRPHSHFYYAAPVFSFWFSNR